MLSKSRALEGYKLVNPGGSVGKVREFYFDDQRWTIHHLVAETGSWPNARQVLISTLALTAVRREEKHIAIELTAKQLEDCPTWTGAGPMPEQTWEVPAARQGPPLRRGAPYMDGSPPRFVADRSERWEPPRDGNPWDARLRSTRDMSGFQAQSVNGEIGRIEDVVIDDGTWAIRYLIIDTRSRWWGRKVLVAAQWVERVSWSGSRVFVKLARETIEHSPECTEGALRTREYEARLHRSYNP